MDDTVNSFLNEINEIAPPIKQIENECLWQECFDDSSGFPYYWNMKSNVVTWDMPDEYKDWLKSSKKNSEHVSKKDDVDISRDVNLVITDKDVKGTVSPKRKTYSDEKKLPLISSYGGDTDTSEDEAPIKEVLNTAIKSTDDENVHPKITNQIPQIETTPLITKDNTITSSAFSLVAVYGDDSDEEEQEVEKEIPPVAHSTLFPIAKKIDIKQFLEPEPTTVPKQVEDVDNKAFKRKKRIDVNLVNTHRPNRNEPSEYKGLGYKEKYSNFTSGGVAFVKSNEVLHPVIETNGEKESLNKEIEDSQVTLREKLLFLSEGREQVSPVQIMLIQLETLYTALKCGSLQSNYLSKWLKEMCDELIKLEEDAAPNGWLLEWDRCQKRYYYRNKMNNECQWDFPSSGDDDAMDICTTPPPPEEGCALQEDDNEDSQSSQIGTQNSPVMVENSELVPPPPPIISRDVEEPLPLSSDSQISKKNISSDLNSVLDSFYSDIAAIESTSSFVPDPSKSGDSKEELTTGIGINEIVPKKKKKVKIAQGISMKKRGVSKLVEKWKNVQKDLN